MVVLSLFLLFGMGMFAVIYDEMGKALPFIAGFFLIWTVACGALIVHAMKVLRLFLKEGKGRCRGTRQPGWSRMGATLRRGCASSRRLKRNGLVYEDEYLRKRAEIMQQDW